MTNPMLEYSKQILQKVSFDPQLFHKELLKATQNLSQSEVQELLVWCKEHFAHLLSTLQF